MKDDGRRNQSKSFIVHFSSHARSSVGSNQFAKMSRIKTLLIIVGLAVLLACVALLRWRRAEPNAATISQKLESIRGPAFEVRVEMPLLSGRPPWELPGVILGFSERGPRFDQASPGARIGDVTPHRLELSADGGWDLLIETDSDGRVAPSTRLIFPVVLGGRPLKFKCRPAEPAVGHFETRARAGSDKLDGSFVVKLPSCKNPESGKTTAGQPVFTIIGSFKELKSLDEKPKD
jgi:hypothetical protein